MVRVLYYKVNSPWLLYPARLWVSIPPDFNQKLWYLKTYKQKFCVSYDVIKSTVALGLWCQCQTWRHSMMFWHNTRTNNFVIYNLACNFLSEEDKWIAETSKENMHAKKCRETYSCRNIWDSADPQCGEWGQNINPWCQYYTWLRLNACICDQTVKKC